MLSKLLRSTAGRLSRPVSATSSLASKLVRPTLTRPAVARSSQSLLTAARRSAHTSTGAGGGYKSGGSGSGGASRGFEFNAWLAFCGVAGTLSAYSIANTVAQAEPQLPKEYPAYDTVLTGKQRRIYEAMIGSMPHEDAKLTFAPEVPPPVGRDYSALVRVDLTTEITNQYLTKGGKMDFWTFNKHCPGPFIRVRQGDMLEIALTNNDSQGMPHNIDLHGTTGPGGGAAVTLAETGQTKVARFRMFAPGLFVYHCAAAPVPMHVANGMYGLILVEPESPLPPVDKEYYVMQSEFYTTEEDDENDPTGTAKKLVFSYPHGLRENASQVVFNGREGSLTDGHPLTAKASDHVRIYFGNAGPNLTSSFHVIGCIFDKVYRDGDLYSPPGRFIQTVTVPPGGATVVELVPHTPGTYTLVDHAIFRLDKGGVGFLNVSGEPRPDVYHSAEGPVQCVGCKLHP